MDFNNNLITITMKIKILIASLLFSGMMYSQVGIGTDTPHASSVLDIDVSQLPQNGKKGFLPPRVTTEQRDLIASPAEGLIVYNLTTHCLNIHNGTEWTNLCDLGNPLNYVTGDIKYSYDPADHDGWYLLDGRTVASLPAEAQVVAQDLGFGSTIPNFANRYVKTTATTSSTATTGGNSSLSLSSSNMPNITLSGTTGSAGAHTHTGTDYYNFLPTPNGSGRWGQAGTSGIQEGYFKVQTTTTAPNHTHNAVTYSSGGSSTPLSINPTYIALNTFVYLGN